jgi:hypothetical protein
MNILCRIKSKPVTLWTVSFCAKLLLLCVFVFPKGQDFVDRFDPHEQPQRYDDREYVQLARRLAEYGVFTIHFGDPSYRSTFRTPGYTVALSLIGYLASWNLFGMLILQAALVSFAPVLLWLILQRLKLPGWPAWLLALDPLLNIVSVTFMTEGLLCLLLTASVACFVMGRVPFWRFAAFILWSLAIFVKPTCCPPLKLDRFV